MSEGWKKEKAFMLRLLEGYDKEHLRNFLIHSDFDVVKRRDIAMSNLRNVLVLSVEPETYIRHQHVITHYTEEIGKLFSDVTKIKIWRATSSPDLEKFCILHNEAVPVVTPWEEINKLQTDLIRQARTASNSVDCQNVGNTARTIMQKLSTIVFDPSEHKADNPNIDLSEGKFKNTLHSYIKSELGTSQREELRKYNESVISTTEKAVDLMNKVTHDLNTDRFYAECCVIGVITSINLIKLIFNKRARSF